MTHPDVAIVGGGVVGAACAYSLSRRDVRAAVLEAGPKPGAATPASGGMLAPFAEAVAEDPLLALCVGAREYYNELSQILLDETGISIGLRTEGIVQVAFTEEEAHELRSAIAWQRQSGFATEWLAEEDLRAQIPGLGPEVVGGALAPEDGGLEPVPLRDALLAAAGQRGAAHETGISVQGLVVRDGRVVALSTEDGQRPVGAVVVAAGAWSGRLEGLPRPLAVEPVRGQMAALPWPEGEPPAIVYGGSGYVLERGGEAIAGSTMERAGFATGTTEEGLRQVFRTMRRIFPALTGKTVTRTWAGLRPGTPDGRPILGADPEIPNLWYATGHGRNGILLAGMTGELLAALYAGEELEHDLSAMDPTRFDQET